MHVSGRGVLIPNFEDHVLATLDSPGLHPLFPGINPEPIATRCHAAGSHGEKKGRHAGVATDGDADRIGAVAEDGSSSNASSFCCPAAMDSEKKIGQATWFALSIPTLDVGRV